MKNRFIAVSHFWFVRSEGFEVLELNSDNIKDAEMEAALIQVNSDNQFKKCAVKVVEIGGDESLFPRNLTWKERFTGKLTADQLRGK